MIYEEMLDAVCNGAICYRSSNPTYRVYREHETIYRSYSERVNVMFLATFEEVKAKDWECVHEQEDPTWNATILVCSYIPEILKPVYERVYQ